MRATILSGLLMAGLFALPACAADYPYAGFFTSADGDADLADARLTCAVGFFRQDKDGSFVSYHLDDARYRADGAVRFLQYNRGLCRLLDGARIEACWMAYSSDLAEIGKIYFDVIRSIAPDEIDTAFFATGDDARSWIAGGSPEPDGEARFVRCGLDDDVLSDALTSEASRLGADDRDAILFPPMNEENRARMAEILDKLLRKP